MILTAGQGGLKAHGLGACELLSRLYWYTIEFGLIRQKEGLRAYEAGASLPFPRRLIAALVTQLGGKSTLTRDNGVRFEMRFPVGG